MTIKEILQGLTYDPNAGIFYSLHFQSLLEIRGFGYLTVLCDLDEDKAVELQDSIAEYIVQAIHEKLTEVYDHSQPASQYKDHHTYELLQRLFYCKEDTRFYISSSKVYQLILQFPEDSLTAWNQPATQFLSDITYNVLGMYIVDAVREKMKRDVNDVNHNVFKTIFADDE